MAGGIVAAFGAGVAQMNAMAAVQHVAPLHAAARVMSTYVTVCYVALACPSSSPDKQPIASASRGDDLVCRRGRRRRRHRAGGLARATDHHDRERRQACRDNRLKPSRYRAACGAGHRRRGLGASRRRGVPVGRAHGRGSRRREPCRVRHRDPRRARHVPTRRSGHRRARPRPRARAARIARRRWRR